MDFAGCAIAFAFYSWLVTTVTMNRSQNTSLSLGSAPPATESLALVRWLSGRHAGTMTHNVPVKWIRDFVESDYSTTESYAVEWRKPPTPRTGGWHVYDCTVLCVSKDVNFLQRQMEANQLTADVSGQRTPSRSLESASSRNSDSTPLQAFSQNDLRDLISQTLSQLNNSDGRPRILEQGDTSTSQCVKKVGTRLILSSTAYIEAKAAASPSVMTINLVRYTFSKNRRRRSTYAGQKRGDIVKPGLKRYRKMQDIQDFVKSRFPHFSQAQFGAAVNSCLGKNVDRQKERMLFDESDSEEEN